MSEAIFEDDNQLKDLEEMLFSMSTDDFIENEISSQLEDTIFTEGKDKRNYVELYMEKYKYLSNVYGGDDALLNDLEENKDIFISNIVNKIADEFEIEVLQEEVGKKMAKALYNFFVVFYADNLKEFFLNYIQRNKKILIAEVKKQKSKVRDVTTIAAKAKYYNANDAIIINNINNILLNLIPSIELGEEFIDYIIEYDDNTVNTTIGKLIKKGYITISQDTYEAFLRPFLERYDGYSNIITDIVMELNQQVKQNPINILT